MVVCSFVSNTISTIYQYLCIQMSNQQIYKCTTSFDKREKKPFEWQFSKKSTGLVLRGLVSISNHVRHHSHHQLLTFFCCETHPQLHLHVPLGKKCYETKTKTLLWMLWLCCTVAMYIVFLPDWDSHVDLVKYLWLSQSLTRNRVFLQKNCHQPTFVVSTDHI